ncbi:DUF397 domain-containing protein [Saccharopolyspora sp. NFXS83]|uniref:DUF397 domain-containing protein n=1 Tax=Saccharopolyspora sp. NFXS83 TaxID=2993560 RepID=UPI00224B34D9|nr:DUF397 domain-containing protein [Saccharopolyspora sp. NFXS83]MCX2734055.1 DUF397 domain-containing protein [Saccharopolyspora sp. NFXS83]
MADLNSRTWRKATRSQGADNCVEVALSGSTTAIRDSKAPEAGHLTANSAQWAVFLNALKSGALDG